MQRTPNFYSDLGLDRADRLRSDHDWLAARLAAPSSRFVPLWQTRSLFDPPPAPSPEAGGEPRAVLLEAAEAEALVARGGERIFLGLDDEERAYFALDVSALDSPDHEPALAGRGSFADLRSFGPLLPRGEGALLAYARAMVWWHDRHRFCGVCGARTESRQGGFQRTCSNPDCGALHFPRTDPAVIMLVHDGGERCVLGRQKVWAPGMHSTLAGFVEPGESLEAAVAREVEEEVGIAVEEVVYHSSQPWPFPSSLMLGFYARTRDRALRVHPTELESARWFDRDFLKASPEDESFKLPRRDSIARRLIVDWLEETA
ncbi:NAD+ diphosphatase [Tistlia consotensis]|uniref:NAD(+) diphosphatase n=1 Tax=Tistlia consotensis USBA 355 TaxID=560819 RepID=A0A1Y6BER3_9PROT|nr:NAD(+) diphosphatase [Tistlia consotensis]SMF07570.1 NAD+ diphosphatase [Tistlia consotensis USBA 355]SNR35810.1 NAD+ diphosphatase [Tistlia consotensis]